ncbi:MAG: UvrD-helicase domain-containing protein, partial [Butyrivibrio sp.]|nr:UvrD-helicase domain-containing protein [Butyrivibrio sp.]
SSIQTQTYEMLKEHSEILSKLQNEIRYIMVDEYQDTNYIQEQLVFMIAGERQNICVVGDDDQGMYRFRGATIRNILEFPSKFPQGACRKIHLEINYRSEPGIIDFYNRWMTNVDGMEIKFLIKKFNDPKFLKYDVVQANNQA